MKNWRHHFSLPKTLLNPWHVARKERGLSLLNSLGNRISPKTNVAFEFRRRLPTLRFPVPSWNSHSSPLPRHIFPIHLNTAYLSSLEEKYHLRFISCQCARLCACLMEKTTLSTSLNPSNYLSYRTEVRLITATSQINGWKFQEKRN